MLQVRINSLLRQTVLCMVTAFQSVFKSILYTRKKTEVPYMEGMPVFISVIHCQRFCDTW